MVRASHFLSPSLNTAYSLQPASQAMCDWRGRKERRVSVFSSPPASPRSWVCALCRARYIGNTACNHEVSKRLFLLCSGVPLQPEHTCLLTSSTMRQQPQIASSDLLKGSLRRGGSASAAQEGDNFIAHVWLLCCPCLSCRVIMCKPEECFSCFLMLLLCWGPTDSTSPPLSLGMLPPKLTRELQVFCSLVGNFIWPFQVGQEQILDLLTMKCFYLSSTKEVQWKDCSCWAKALHLLQSSYAFTSGTSVKALLTLADVHSFHRKLVNLSVSSACFTYLWENMVFDSLARSCNDRNAISR